MSLSDNKNAATDLLKFYFLGLVLLTFSGLLFKVLFVAYNREAFSALSLYETGYALIWGIRFDLASAAFFSFLSSFLVYVVSAFRSKIKVQTGYIVYTLLLVMAVQMSLQTGDTVYFAESGRHVSYEIRDALTDASGLFFTALVNHTAFILISLLIAITLLFVSRSLVVYVALSGVTVFPHFRRKINNGIQLIISLLITVILLRGGVTGLPQSVIYAFKIGDPLQAVATMNGAYSVVYGAINSRKEITLPEVRLPEGTAVNEIMRKLYPHVPSTSAQQVDMSKIRPYNLIFILMEGWPADFMSAYGYEAETTPFYAALMKKSLTPLGVIAGGVRTTEGIYTTFCSQQNPLGKTIAQTSLQNNHFSCLPAILKKLGWHTAFFQGTHKDTSGTGAFAQSLGFTESYAKEDMPPGRYNHNNWGAHDPDIYDYILEKLDSMSEPFLIGVNTNTTHDIQLPDGVEGYFGMADNLSKHRSVLRFSDQAMKEFFRKIKQKPYYSNTVFILMSDHTHDQHPSLAAKYFIPGLVYAEHILQPETVNRYVSQRDFAPTILDILGLPASTDFSGKSFIGKAKDIYFADYYDAGMIGWVKDAGLVETSIANPDVQTCYSIERGLLHAKRVECDMHFNENSVQSLVFTKYSQELLFSDQTRKFYQFARFFEK